MTASHETIRDQSWDQLEQKLKPGMVMVLRRALSTGRSGPALSRWLNDALRFLPDAPDAESLASLLCSGLSRSSRPTPSGPASTVVQEGRQHHGTHS